MEGYVELKDGTPVTIRPLNISDMDRSLNFFQTLAEEDRAYLRADVTNYNFIKQRIEDMEKGLVKRLIAISGDDIIADGSLELEERGWKEHVGELRLIVSPTFRRKGVGMFLAHELYLMAVAEKLEQLIVKIMKPQNAGIKIFKRLGFKEEAVLAGYVKDAQGRKQDLILMRCDIREMWQELEEYMEAEDWQRVR